ncbi:protein ORF37 [Cyprinid herpesvirus 3]|uniref:Uncharacterized protein n=1 Tax=Cyprinid herpesvirus 3 TaxID=180230 RepID=A4FTE4_CYHV3|nr:protein ORF37 [Cyprinid herpesvirus 3]AOO32760.1 protein ORF37 [Cyprinid herpesvirus 3]AOO32917.1 protein ORF37 [Cyprinid herpesvirus 3]AOO33073.1 protein ORF37 [Cyprinid herpesvirus 3]AOO33229.1 protein ORF37 [Cyprinid herpesvirus 3]
MTNTTNTLTGPTWSVLGFVNQVPDAKALLMGVVLALMGISVLYIVGVCLYLKKSRLIKDATSHYIMPYSFDSFPGFIDNIRRHQTGDTDTDQIVTTSSPQCSTFHVNVQT